jgi:hypothetical protein
MEQYIIRKQYSGFRAKQLSWTNGKPSEHKSSENIRCLFFVRNDDHLLALSTRNILNI